MGRARPRGKGARDRVGCRGGTRGGASEVRRGWGGVQEEGGSGFAGRLGGKAGVLRREGSAG